MTEAITSLVGPNVRLHHTKINSKLPGAATQVKWHQDLPLLRTLMMTLLQLC